MNDLTRWLRSGYQHVLVAFILPGCLATYALPAAAQDQTGVVTIPNTATASFQAPNGSRQPVLSNTVNVPVRAGVGQLELIKTGDRQAAEPGDTVAYRLLARNTGTAILTNLAIVDTLPLGLKFLANSARASLTTGSTSVPVPLAAPTVSGQTITFTYPRLALNQTLTLVYAVIVTPDAVRGSGRNLAVASGQTPAATLVTSNASSHLLRIRPGIFSDCGTIVGRVFIDKNFDGEQQPGEPGVPNAVIFMDDGNRIVTDANGMFSLPNVIAGYRTGTLDLSSIPGYTLAPNRYRIEGNSPSRLVRLAPGGMVRMNFAVTPTFQETTGGRR